ncbi:MAG: DivIVA domain-containing protein [Bacillota bacterium]
MITPNDIETKTFKKVQGGYSPEEVDSFLDDILEDYDKLYTMAKNIQADPSLVAGITKTAPAESAQAMQTASVGLQEILEKTLLLAEETAHETKTLAVKQGTQIVESAKLEASTMLHNAREKYAELSQQIATLESRYELMRTRVKLLLYAEIELLDKNEIIAEKENQPQKEVHLKDVSQKKESKE